MRALDESPPCAEQDEARVTYADKITAADRQLDPSRPADELERTVRALTPHIGAYVALADGTPLGVREAQVGPPRDGGAGETRRERSRSTARCRCSRSPTERSSSSSCSLPGKRPMPGERLTCAGAGEPRRPRPSAAPSPRREPARTPSSAGCSSRGPTPTERSRPRPSALDPRDRALATAIAYGAVQRRRTLDHVAQRLSSRPLDRLDPPVLAALRLGLFQLLYLGGVADYAAVDESVELAKRVAPGGGGARQCGPAPRRRGGPGDRRRA